MKWKFFENLELERNDFWIIGIVLSIFSITCFFYLQDERSLSQANGEVVGTVVYRNRIAQRKNSQTVIWENVEQEEKVKNFDSIRTDDRAEAVITLLDGTKIELDPFSMIVLNISKKSSKIDLQRGSLVVTPSDLKNVEIQKGNKLIYDFSKAIRIFGDETERIRIFSEGEAFLSSRGSENKIPSKTILEISDAEILKMKPIIGLLSPNDNIRYFIDKPSSQKVRFQWNPENPTEYLFSLSKDPFFQETILKLNTKETFLDLELSEGNYYWKVSSVERESIPRRLRIRFRDQIWNREPADSETLVLDVGDLTAFSWTESEFASKYKIEISPDKSFSNPVKTLESYRLGISVSLGEGNYYWRVLGVGSIEGSNAVSVPTFFRIERPKPKEETVVFEVSKNLDSAPKNDSADIVPPGSKTLDLDKVSKNTINSVEEALKPPVLIYPISSVDMTGKERIFFKWEKVENAKYYEIVLKDSAGKILLQKVVSVNQYNFTDLTKLDVGIFSWEVSSISNLGKKFSSKPISFKIFLSTELEAPEIQVQK